MRIDINLEFFRPFKANNTASFSFQPNGNQATVTWSMNGNRNLMMKVFGLFMSMDKMLGGEFEKGLGAMKQVVETAKK